MALAQLTLVRVTELQMKEARIWTILSKKILFLSLITTVNMVVYC